jgi:hypothetical protein
MGSVQMTKTLYDWFDDEDFLSELREEDLDLDEEEEEYEYIEIEDRIETDRNSKAHEGTEEEPT